MKHLYEGIVKGVYSVGYYDDNQQWHEESVYAKKESAIERVAYLNGDKNGFCTWIETEHKSHGGNWLSDCGLSFSLTWDSPADHDMHYCCKCGKPLRQQSIEQQQSELVLVESNQNE